MTDSSGRMVKIHLCPAHAAEAPFYRESRCWFCELLARAEKVEARVRELEREVAILRYYGNKECTAMADEALEENNDDDD